MSSSRDTLVCSVTYTYRQSIHTIQSTSLLKVKYMYICRRSTSSWDTRLISLISMQIRSATVTTAPEIRPPVRLCASVMGIFERHQKGHKEAGVYLRNTVISFHMVKTCAWKDLQCGHNVTAAHRVLQCKWHFEL